MKTIKLQDALTQLSHARSSEIPEYDKELIQQCKNQIKDLMNQLKNLMKAQKQDTTQGNEEIKVWRKIKSGLLYDEYARIKRFLLIYLNQRYNKIENQFWSYGANIKESEKQHLSQNQKAYLIKYKSLVMDYATKTGLQLTIDMDPPTDVHIEVRVLVDCGEILNQNGQVIRLAKGSVHYISRKLIEAYIQQGFIVVNN